jgi:hypothetical protein
VHAADGLANIVIGGGCNGAGIQYHQVRGRTLAGGLEALGREEALQSGAVGLGSPATKILNEEFPHLFLLCR